MKGQRAEPPVVALRQAAARWYLASLEPAADSRDSVFRRFDTRLQRAALRFAAARRLRKPK